MVADANGNTWVYTNPEPLAFVRHHIAIDFIDGDEAVLLDGPPPGTPVVTVGSTMLAPDHTGCCPQLLTVR